VMPVLSADKIRDRGKKKRRAATVTALPMVCRD